MKPSKFVTAIGAKKRRSFSIKSLPTLALLCAAVFIGSTFIVTDYKERFSPQGVLNIFLRTQSMKCQGRCKPIGTEALPKGIISSTSDLEMRPLWGTPVKKKSDKNLLAMAVGLKHEERVDKIVRKFIGYNFAVMLFHYDGNVDDWSDFKWSTRVLHVVAAHQIVNGGLQSVSYILILFHNTRTFSFGTKTLELKTSMFNGTYPSLRKKDYRYHNLHLIRKNRRAIAYLCTGEPTRSFLGEESAMKIAQNLLVQGGWR